LFCRKWRRRVQQINSVKVFAAVFFLDFGTLFFPLFSTVLRTQNVPVKLALPSISFMFIFVRECFFLELQLGGK
jgi:hypothetical protein